jgi:hypothetical protein
MRIFSLLAISLALAVAAPVGHTVYVPAKLKAMDVPLSKLDPRFGNMVAEAPCSVPYIFVNGTIAQAPQVNANFAAVTGCLNNIYASDIQPNNNTQATFGGNSSITYTFPGAIQVNGSGNGGYTETPGTVPGLWFVANGSAPVYAFNFQAPAATPCGSSGLAQWDVGLTSSPSPSPVPVSNLGCQGPLRVQNTEYLPTASPGPVPPCFTISSNPCPDGFHTISNTGSAGMTIALPTACPNNATCATTGTTANITFGGVGGSPWTNEYTCEASSLQYQGIYLQVGNQSLSVGVVQIYNATGAAFTAASLSVWYTCSGV